MTKLEVTFLGTTASIPTPTRNHPALYLRYISENEFCYLFDCGEGTQKQIFSSGLNFMKIRDIFITHWHADHYAGLFGLLETMTLEGRKEELRIFAPQADKFVDMILEMGYSSRGFEIVPKDVPSDGSKITILLDQKDFQIKSIPVKHGIPAVAYSFEEKDRTKIDKKKAKKKGLPEKGKIYQSLKNKKSIQHKDKTITLKSVSYKEKGKKFIYSGDTKPCTNMLKLASNAHVLVHDSTYFEDLKRKHTTFDEVRKIAQEANVKKTILTHISRRYNNMEELEDKVKKYKNFYIAKDFMTINV